VSCVYAQDFDELDPWIRAEVVLDSDVARGRQGTAVRRVQEWLTLQGHGLVVDGDFGPATERSVTDFQSVNQIGTTGAVDQDTWWELVRPMRDVLGHRLEGSWSTGEAALAYAQAHLEAHPREVGGANRGPWVRLYMHGRQGVDAPWCAGFTTFVTRQAADSTGVEPPIAGSSSCDALASQAKAAGVFLGQDTASPDQITPGALFLVRRTDTDWTHTGLVVTAEAETFGTVEGNTNDDGDREGYEVCARTRGYADKDFILL